MSALGIRWTIGDVSDLGFEALRLSVWGAFKIFGAGAGYAICVNSLALDEARRRTGALPVGVQWHQATAEQIPAFLRAHLDRAFAEGVAWKFAPLRLFADRHELALDNDCILWRLPEAVERWLGEPHSALIAEDVSRCFGQFSPWAGAAPRNSGIRGLPPDFDYGLALAAVLALLPAKLSSELDEQGLQVAALQRTLPVAVVAVEEVTICSPFPPHLAHLGQSGAHFVGLNAKRLPWSLNGRPAVVHLRDHWHALRPRVEEKLGLAPRLQLL